jgi:hypothetical protein
MSDDNDLSLAGTTEVWWSPAWSEWTQWHHVSTSWETNAAIRCPPTPSCQIYSRLHSHIFDAPCQLTTLVSQQWRQITHNGRGMTPFIQGVIGLWRVPSEGWQSNAKTKPQGSIRKVMQEDSSTWDALWFLDQMKESNRGFDYRVKHDHSGRPKAVCWMLPEMRSDVIRFGNCLFLNSQKRRHNIVGWPYIGPPVVKDSKFKFGVLLSASVLMRAIVRMSGLS